MFTACGFGLGVVEGAKDKERSEEREREREGKGGKKVEAGRERGKE